MPRYKMMNNVKVQFTAEEEAERDAKIALYDSKSGERKLVKIKEYRLINRNTIVKLKCKGMVYSVEK